MPVIEDAVYTVAQAPIYPPAAWCTDCHRIVVRPAQHFCRVPAPLDWDGIPAAIAELGRKYGKATS
jgi:hypothetical protein